MERELAIPDKRRKELVALVLQHTKKNMLESLFGAQPALLETVQGLEKNGRFLTPPPTTIASPFEGVTVEWSSTHDFLHVRAKTTGTCVLTLSTHEVSGLHRLALIVVDAVDGIVSTGMSLYAAARSAHVSMKPRPEDNDHLVRGVNRFFHEDGTVTGDDETGDPAQTADKSPLHREGGPAELHGSPYYWPGRTGWWRRGKLHREDGPALYIRTSAVRRQIARAASRPGTSTASSTATSAQPASTRTGA